MPDYFDRLLARYTPVPAAGVAARVRPRLPGPFERVEALRSAPPEPDEPAALIPSAPQPAFGPTELIRHEREVRTDRHTVVRTEAAGPGGRQRPADATTTRTDSAPRPPAARTAPGPRPADSDGARPARRPGPRPRSDAPTNAPAGSRRETAPAPPAATAPARPRSTDLNPARGATPSGVGRRAPKPAERVVHVQIGRLEVSAAPPPGANRGATDSPDRTGRRAPALTLDDYLARGEKRN